MLGISEVVIFGIKAGVKLANQGRQAYIDRTINQDLTLPLPNFNTEFGLPQAFTYFKTAGKKHLDRDPELKKLIDSLKNASLNEQDKNLLISSAKELKGLDDLENGSIRETEIVETGLTPDALNSLVSVRQFARNRGNPPGLQRILGTVIETGADLFNQFPGIINQQSSAGRALSGFLGSIDDLPFADQRADVLARDLFIAAVETIHVNQNLFGADDKTENLIRSVSKGLVADISARLTNLKDSPVKRMEVERWGQIVLRSVLSNVGESVLANPKSLGLDDPGQQAIVSSIGATLLDTILQEDSVDLRPLFSRPGLDRIVNASLSAVAEHPEIFGSENKGIQKIISQLATGLDSSMLNRDMLPEVARLVIEKTAQNADLLWPDRFNEGGRHLLVTASTMLLNQLAQPAGDGAGWKPSFTKSQLNDLLETIVDEVAQNPSWLLEAANGQSFLEDALSAALSTLKAAPADRLSAETGENVLKSIIKTVALRREFLDIIPGGTERKLALTVILENLIDVTLSDNVDPKARWTLARGEIFSALATAVMDRLSRVGVSTASIEAVIGVVKDGAARLVEGGAWDLEILIDRINDANLTTPA